MLILYVVCLLFYAVGGFLFVSIFVFLLFRSARKHRLGEGRVLFILSIYACFQCSQERSFVGSLFG